MSLLDYKESTKLRLVVENQKKRIIGVNDFFYTIIVGVKDKVYLFIYLYIIKLEKIKSLLKLNGE